MNLLYVSGTYMPASGGAEISMFTLLRELARSERITVLTRAPAESEPRFGSAVNIAVHGARDKAEAALRLRSILASDRPDVLITQNAWSDLGLHEARRAGVPAVYFARTASANASFTNPDEYRCDLIVSNSQAVASFIQQTWGRPSVVIPSPIDPHDYVVQAKTDECLTMVNPIEMKGGRIVAQLADALPDRRFLVVRGWNHLRGSGAWNDLVLRDLAEGLGDGEPWDPGDVEFDANPNVTVVAGTDDMRSVYARTRLLLVPSLRCESCPRVAVEAMCSGIPVVGSCVGGIPAAIGAGGSVVHDYTDVGSWASAIRAYDDPETYARASAGARAQFGRHDPKAIAQRVLEAVASLLRERRSYR